MYDWLQAAIAKAQGTNPDWRFVLNQPAQASALARCEPAVGPLPDELRAFLQFHDGASLFREEIDFGGGQVEVGAEVAIFGVDEIAAHTLRLREMYGDAGRIMVIGHIPGTGGDRIAMDPDQGFAVLDGHQDMSPGRWRERVIAPSFEEWLKRLFEAHPQQPYYWLSNG